MSQVFESHESNGIPVLTAGNTVETLNSTNRDIAASNPTAETDEGNTEQLVTNPENVSDTVEEISAEEFLDEENTFDVSRAEFIELQDAFLRLYNGVVAYNKTSPHKILGV